MDSILRTAEGTQEDRFIVIATDEAYTLIGVLGLENRGPSLMSCNEAPCDLFELHDPRDGANLKFYFDVSIPFGHMRRQLDQDWVGPHRIEVAQSSSSQCHAELSMTL